MHRRLKERNGNNGVAPAVYITCRVDEINSSHSNIYLIAEKLRMRHVWAEFFVFYSTPAFMHW